MRTLTITWQRLVEGEETCPRCGDTGAEVRKATALLRRALEPLGIAVALEEAEIGLEEFRRRPLESNRITIGTRTVEEWLGGTTGQSPCCDVCGPHDCRTLTVDGQTHEAIPSDLIVRAGLMAAASRSDLVDAQPCRDPLVAGPRKKGSDPADGRRGPTTKGR